jgi:hypothetical protein
MILLGVPLFGFEQLWNLGLGAPNPAETEAWSPNPGFTDFNVITLWAGSPSAVLSLLYLVTDSIFCSMLGADEWSRFGKSKQSLRVSCPIEDQRSTYFLHMPYIWALVCPCLY